MNMYVWEETALEIECLITPVKVLIQIHYDNMKKVNFNIFWKYQSTSSEVMEIQILRSHTRREFMQVLEKWLIRGIGVS